MQQIHIGTAGWQLPKTVRQPDSGGTGLTRYAQLFNAVEINSTHYKQHMERTFQRWAESVPAAFRFAVKMHRSITHVERFTRIRSIRSFLQEVSALGDRLGPVLIQLPPSLAYRDEQADLLLAIGEDFSGTVVLEARHASWSEARVQEVLKEARISLVAADPPLITKEFQPRGYMGTAYFRLHGSPRVYWSPYSEETLDRLSVKVKAVLAQKRRVWVIFDNTAAGEAAVNALQFGDLFKQY